MPTCSWVQWEWRSIGRLKLNLFCSLDLCRLWIKNKLRLRLQGVTATSERPLVSHGHHFQKRVDFNHGIARVRRTLFMNNNGITKILNVVLALCLLAAMVVSVQFVFQTRGYRADSARAAGVREWQAVLRGFASDCVAYSKQNPDIIPILDTVGWTGNKPAAPAKSATK